MKILSSIKTERLILRNLARDDATLTYLSWVNDLEINKYLESRFSIDNTLQNLVDYIEKMNESSDNLLLGIFIRSENKHIGNIKIGPIVLQHSRAEIGYLIGDKLSWGKGYATEAIVAACSYSIEKLGIIKINAGVYETNIGSSKALVKAGFSCEANLSSNVISEGIRIATKIYGLVDNSFFAGSIEKNQIQN